MATGGDNDVLSPTLARAISHRRGHGRGGQMGLPNFLACFRIKCPERAIKRRSDKRQAAGGRKRTTQGRGA